MTILQPPSKVTHARLLSNGIGLVVNGDGHYLMATVPLIDARLVRSGQRAEWPETPGSAILHDLPPAPAPAPVPAPWEWWANVYAFTTDWFRSLSDANESWHVLNRTRLIHVWQDDAGLHAEDVTQ